MGKSKRGAVAKALGHGFRTRTERRGGQNGNKRGKTVAQLKAARLADTRAQTALADTRTERQKLDAWLADVAEREARSAAFAAALAAPGPWEKGMGAEACAALKADIIRRSRWSVTEAATLIEAGYSLNAVARRSGWDVYDLAAELRTRGAHGIRVR